MVATPTSVQSGRRFTLGVEVAPDETTVCTFRHLLEKHELGKKLLVSVNEHLRRSGIKITTGTIVDATIIGAPSSTKKKGSSGLSVGKNRALIKPRGLF